MSVPETKLPNLLIVGYHKAGTTTLFHELSKHPDIYPSVVKEPFYFRPYINGKALPPIAEYEKHFLAAQGETYRMEGSPTYVYGGKRAALKIKEVLGDVKIIISLRNPIDQLFSLYKHHLRFMKIDRETSFLSFLQSKEDFQRQYYDLHLQEWFDVFGDNVKCIFFKPLVQTPQVVIPEIFEWLGLEPYHAQSDTFRNTNPGGMYKNSLVHKVSLSLFRRFKRFIPHQAFVLIRNLYFVLNGKPTTQEITQEAIDYLSPILAPHNMQLASLLKQHGYQQLPAWLQE